MSRQVLSSFNVSVEASASHVPGRSGRGYTITVWAEADFDLRVAHPSQPMGRPVAKLSDPLEASTAPELLPPVPMPSVEWYVPEVSTNPAVTTIDNPIRFAGNPQ